MQKIFIVLFKIFWVVEMMSREQLEEIREIDQEVGNGFAIEDLDLNTMTVVNREHFNWLIEQAERVQELEKIKESHIEELGYVDERLLEAEHQNKCYRESIQNAFFQLTNEKIEYANWKAQVILDKALEGDK